MYPVITLTTGLRVANFSSPHSFEFVDGSVLPACSEERARSFMLDYKEIEHPDIKGTVSVEITWQMTVSMLAELESMHHDDSVDIILVPLPVMTALKSAKLSIGKCRVIRVADRISKKIHIDKFCR